MIVKYPLTMNGESRNVRVPGTHQVLSSTEILSSVRVLRVSDDETSRVGEADSFGGLLNPFNTLFGDNPSMDQAKQKCLKGCLAQY